MGGRYLTIVKYYPYRKDIIPDIFYFMILNPIQSINSADLILSNRRNIVHKLNTDMGSLLCEMKFVTLIVLEFRRVV